MASVQSEIESWLQTILKDENLKEMSVKILGNSEKGDGYIGDIVFVTVDGIDEKHSTKTYNLVIKCSKRSEALRENLPITQTFLNEIMIYETTLPYFCQFQQEKGVPNPFNSIPKCYGSYIGENMEVIVLENLKSIGYELWPKKHPLTRKHVELVVTEYGKFHATSLALQQKRPKEFQKLVDGTVDLFESFSSGENRKNLFTKPMRESAELLKNDLDQEILQKWEKSTEKIDYIFDHLYKNISGLKVILHGDCWNNNFMYLHKEGPEKVPLKVAFLDWQGTRYNTPILDLSYFLFACTSEEDLQSLEEILLRYHDSFVNQLRNLEINNADTLYSEEVFFNDWKTYSVFGVLMASVVMKIVSTEKDEVVDIAESADSGKDFTEGFMSEIRDKENYKKRIRPIVEYVVKNNLI